MDQRDRLGGRRRIIVNADDYGYTRGVSAGIRQAFRDGVLSSATAMMNMPGVEADIAAAGAEVGSLKFGVHLVLTAGRPLMSPMDVPTLVTEDGNFHRLSTFAARVDDFALADVELEWSRQIEALIACGVEVDHLDSHHHSAYLHPTTARAMLNLASRYGVPVRRPPAPPQSHPTVPALFEQHGVLMPDRFVGDLITGSSPEMFAALVQAVPVGTIAELMVHPGLVDDDLLRVSSYAQQRAAELATLLHPDVLALVDSTDLRLATFGDLRTATFGDLER